MMDCKIDSETTFGGGDKCKNCPDLVAYRYPYWCERFKKFVWDAVKICMQPKR